MSSFFHQQVSRSFLAFVASSLLFFVNQGYALGLGEIKTSSYLGQPLVASIAVNTGGEDYAPEELRVRQLSAVQARALGIDLADAGERYLLSLEEQSGKIVVRLSSSDPITEPFLNVVVELKWPTGTIYREYTLFLDPIGFGPPIDTNQQSPSEAPVSNNNSNQRTPSNLSSGTGSYGVQSGDSLSKIAAQLVEGTDTSRQEMMRWLLENNPKAFRNGDMNRLMAGANLTLPKQAQRLTAEPPRNADKPTQPSQSPATTSPVVNSAEPASAPPAATETSPAAPESERLTIVTPNTTRSSVSDEELSQAETILALRDTVVATQELADTLKRENEMMVKRLNAIEKSGYLTSMERLVELKEQEILALKTQLNQNQISQVVANQSSNQPSSSSDSASSNGDSATTDKQGEARFWWLVLLLVLAVIGAIYFFVRWQSSKQQVKLSARDIAENEEALLSELDNMAVSAAPSSQARKAKPQPKSTTSEKSNKAAIESTKQGFRDLSQRAVTEDGRRSEDQIMASIREKTDTYIPNILEGKHESDYDELDHLIAEALAAANRGSFGVAEALLLAERTEQVRKPAKRENDGDLRLQSAIDYVEQLRKIKYSHHDNQR